MARRAQPCIAPIYFWDGSLLFSHSNSHSRPPQNVQRQVIRTRRPARNKPQLHRNPSFAAPFATHPRRATSSLGHGDSPLWLYRTVILTLTKHAPTTNSGYRSWATELRLRLLIDSHDYRIVMMYKHAKANVVILDSLVLLDEIYGIKLRVDPHCHTEVPGNRYCIQLWHLVTYFLMFLRKCLRLFKAPP